MTEAECCSNLPIVVDLFHILMVMFCSFLSNVFAIGSLFGTKSFIQNILIGKDSSHIL